MTSLVTGAVTNAITCKSPCLATQLFCLPLFSCNFRHTLFCFFMVLEEEDVVHAILYLLSDKASMIHGTTLPVDGGCLAC